jgi:hypothetical protein
VPEAEVECTLMAWCCCEQMEGIVGYSVPVARGLLFGGSSADLL